MNSANKFGTIDVFDIMLYDVVGNLIFTIDSATQVTVETKGNDGLLHIKDGLIDKVALDMITSSELDRKSLSLYGTSVWRSLDMKDYHVEMTMPRVVLWDYKLDFKSGKPSISEFNFTFTNTKDERLDINLTELKEGEK